MEYLRTDTVSVGTLYRKAAKLSRGAGAYFCKHFVPAGAQGGLPSLPPADPAAAVFAGGLALFAASLPCLSGRRRGLGGFGRLPTLPLVCFLSPIPPTPFPPGRGRLKVYFAGGEAPGTPALDRLRHLQPLPCGHPGAEPMVRRKNDRKRFSMSSAGSQGEGGPGEMELSVASDGGV